MDLTGHRALVCGASKGIGKEIAIALAEAGAELVLLARSEEALQTTLKTLKKNPAHEYLVVDMADYHNLKARVHAVVREKPVNILVNNCAGPAAGPLMEAAPEALLEAFQTHILAAHTLTQLLVPGMKEQRYGRIINIISTSVKVPIPNLGVSNTVRGAMASWAKTLANELGAFGITVNNILPGYTATDRLDALKAASAKRMNVDTQAIAKQWLDTIPAGRFAAPQETAAAALFLASKMASYINGINLPVDGGRTGAL